MGCGNSNVALVNVSQGAAGGPQEQQHQHNKNERDNRNPMDPDLLPKPEVVRAPKPPDPSVEIWSPTNPKDRPTTWPDSHLTRFPPVKELSGQIYFSAHEIPRIHPVGRDQFHSSESIHMRAFLPHPLTGYCIGIIRVDFTPEYPHHIQPSPTTQSQPGSAFDGAGPSQHVVSASRYRKYHLFITTVREILLTFRCGDVQRTALLPVDPTTVSSEATFTYPLRVDPLMLSTSSTKSSLATANTMKGFEPLQSVFQSFTESLPDGHHTVLVEMSFRYDNQNFAAITDKDMGSRSFVYTYSDPLRTETATTGVIASGTFQLTLDWRSGHLLRS